MQLHYFRKNAVSLDTLNRLITNPVISICVCTYFGMIPDWHRRRWPGIQSALYQCLVCAGQVCVYWRRGHWFPHLSGASPPPEPSTLFQGCDNGCGVGTTLKQRWANVWLYINCNNRRSRGASLSISLISIQRQFLIVRLWRNVGAELAECISPPDNWPEFCLQSLIIYSLTGVSLTIGKLICTFAARCCLSTRWLISICVC